ncbi:MAG: hypothetical protein LBP29_07795, partial [Treponema sp.]|nr:hypothetical protein [Treponema sp.]
MPRALKRGRGRAETKLPELSRKPCSVLFSAETVWSGGVVWGVLTSAESGKAPGLSATVPGSGAGRTDGESELVEDPGESEDEETATSGEAAASGKPSESGESAGSAGIAVPEGPVDPEGLAGPEEPADPETFCEGREPVDVEAEDPVWAGEP